MRQLMPPWRSLDNQGPNRGKQEASLALPDDEGVRRLVTVAHDALARRSLSRRQLETRLRREPGTDEEIARALDWLSGRGLLDDAAMARQAARSALSRRGWGRHRLLGWLVSQGIERDVAEAALEDMDSFDEAARAATLASAQAARGRRPDQIYRFLMGRGFSSSIVRAAVFDATRADLDDADPDPPGLSREDAEESDGNDEPLV